MIHNNNSNNAPFEVDERVSLKVEFDLAMRVADVILASGTTDKQVLALGHNLKNLEEDSFHRPRSTNGQENWNDFKPDSRQPSDDIRWNRNTSQNG